MSLCVCMFVCFFAISFETAIPNEIIFLGMIPLRVQMDLGKILLNQTPPKGLDRSS